jgi:HD-like signal output (HDOD) protein
MVAKVLQLVNSSFFGLRSEVRDLRQAVAYLGVETLRDFALAGAVFRAFRSSPLLPDGWLICFNNHSQAVADATTHLVRTSLAQCEASVAGMLHGVGELIVAERAPSTLLAIAADVSSGTAPDEAELRHLGTTYPVIGGYLLSQWGMGYHIVEAVTCHRDERTGPNRDPELGDVIHVADHLAAREHLSDKYDDEFMSVDLADEGPKDWVCLASRGGNLDDTYLERVGLLGAVMTYHQGLVPQR